MIHKKTAKPVVTSLLVLLEQERHLLIDGALGRVVDLAKEKEGLIERLSEETSTSLPELKGVQSKARENQALFEAALSGLQSVVERLSALKRLQSGFETYDRDGHLHQHGAKRSARLEKRA